MNSVFNNISVDTDKKKNLMPITSVGFIFLKEGGENQKGEEYDHLIIFEA